mmetsp:Transcript_67962/g.196887  ORF Transcript_67962/g.196887 Transcript_67962/m.196887 type:complete len:254 (-) Transcript_67962:2075-2836(-)
MPSPSEPPTSSSCASSTAAGASPASAGASPASTGASPASAARSRLTSAPSLGCFTPCALAMCTDLARTLTKPHPQTPQAWSPPSAAFPRLCLREAAVGGAAASSGCGAFTAAATPDFARIRRLPGATATGGGGGTTSFGGVSIAGELSATPSVLALREKYPAMPPRTGVGASPSFFSSFCSPPFPKYLARPPRSAGPLTRNWLMVACPVASGPLSRGTTWNRPKTFVRPPCEALLYLIRTRCRSCDFAMCCFW